MKTIHNITFRPHTHDATVVQRKSQTICVSNCFVTEHVELYRELHTFD